MRSLTFVLLFCLLGAQLLTAQSRSTKSIGLAGDYGFVIPHSATLASLKNTYPVGVQGEFAWQMTTERWWNSCNCFPRMGFVMSYWDFDKTEILGRSVTAQAFFEPVYFTRSRFTLSLRAALGLSYQSNPYDSISNPQNVAYSTYIAFPITVNLGFNYRISPRINLHLTANYNHISNGGVRLPNKGVNWPTAGLGLDYALSDVEFPEFEKSGPRVLKDKHRFTLTAFGTARNQNARDPVQYPVLGAHIQYGRYIGRTSYLTLGTEWIWDKSRKKRIEGANLDLDHQRGSFTLGHEFVLGKTVFGQALGVYYYDPFGVTDPVYQRFYLTYHVLPSLTAGVGLLTHRHVANFLDLRVSWVL